MTSPWPSAILVDLDNTLHDYRATADFARQQLCNAIENDYGIASEIVLSRYEALMAETEDADFATGAELRRSRLRRLLCHWPETKTASAEHFAVILEDTLLNAIVPFEGAIETYNELRTRSRVVIVTEGYGDMQTAIVQRLGLPTGTDDLLVTRSHGVRKRDSSAFHLATKLLELPAHKLVMVGDNWDWDIVASAEAGLRQVWIAKADRPGVEPPLGYLGRTKNICEVPDLIVRRWPVRG
jgi:FMN phosphatase YigB (HAD superfamily)